MRENEMYFFEIIFRLLGALEAQKFITLHGQEWLAIFHLLSTSVLMPEIMEAFSDVRACIFEIQT